MSSNQTNAGAIDHARGSVLRVIAFDLVHTVFDTTTVDAGELSRYIECLKLWRVGKEFKQTPPLLSFYNMKMHPDSLAGLQAMRAKGYRLIAASNLPPHIVGGMSAAAGWKWDGIMDFQSLSVYKPALVTYASICDSLNCRPEEVLFVTANPGSGDASYPQHIGMRTAMIRQAGWPATVGELAEQLGPCVVPLAMPWEVRL